MKPLSYKTIKYIIVENIQVVGDGVVYDTGMAALFINVFEKRRKEYEKNNGYNGI